MVNYEQKYLRKAIASLLANGMERKEICKKINLNAGNLSRFLNNRQDLSEATIAKIYEVGLIARPSEDELKGIAHKPLEEWNGELLTVREASENKGYSPATIRKWCKTGKLNYVKRGRRYCVAMDEKYDAIAESEKAVLRKKVQHLEDRIKQLETQVETKQLNYNFNENSYITEENQKLKHRLNLAEKQVQAKEQTNRSLSNQLLDKKCKLENLQKENLTLREVLTEYQNTVSRLSIRRAKSYINPLPQIARVVNS